MVAAPIFITEKVERKDAVKKPQEEEETPEVVTGKRRQAQVSLQGLEEEVRAD